MENKIITTKVGAGICTLTIGIFGFAFLLFPAPTFGAIVHDNIELYSADTTTASRTVSFAMGNISNAWIGCYAWTNNVTATAMTYNGQNMTNLFAERFISGGERMDYWVATTTAVNGTYTVKLLFPGTVQTLLNCYSASGVNQFNFIDATSSFSGASGNGDFRFSTTSTYSNTYAIAVQRSQAISTYTATGTLTTLVGASTDQGIFDNRNGVTPAGNPVIIETHVTPSATETQTFLVNLRGTNSEGETATGQLLFPLANTSTSTIPDWNGNWVTQINAPVIGNVYYTRVRYSLISSSNPSEPQNNFQTWNDYVSFTSDSTSTEIWAFPKTHPLANLPGSLNTSTTYGWLISYAFGTDPTFSTPISTSSWNVYINYFSPRPTSTASTYAGSFTSTSTYNEISASINSRFGITSFGCNINATSTYDFWNPADWKCMFVGTLNEVASTTLSYGSVAFDTGVSIFKNIFPFNVIITINEKINESAHPTNLDYNLYWINPLTQGTSTIKMVSSGTVAWIEDETGWNYRDFLSMLFYTFTGWILYKTASKTIQEENSTA